MSISYIHEYITSAEDTIYKISVRFYYRWDRWRLIYDANSEALGSDPFDIPPGVKIQIPDILIEDKKHTIKEGETYYVLSRDYYGTERFHREIRIANDFIMPETGMEIVVPALATRKEIDIARRIRNAYS